MEYSEIAHQASNNMKTQKYALALPLYEEIISKYKENCTSFEYSSYASCLLKLDMYQQALDAAHEGLVRFPESKYLKSTYTWAIYHLYIKPEPIANRAIFFKAVDAIIQFSKSNDKYSALPLTIFQAIDLLEEDYDKNASQILSLVQRLNPVILSRKPYSYRLPDGKQVTMASHFEKYYAIRVKALYENQLFEQCIALANEVSGTLTRFHHHNDLWITRLKALAQFRLGLYNECIAGLTAVLSKKPEWFIRKEIAEVYMATGNYTEAANQALIAMQAPGDPLMKLNLYLLLARTYAHEKRSREASLLAAYVNLLRRSKSWPDDVEATQIIEHNAQAGYTLPDMETASQQLKELIKAQANNIPRIEGKIDFLLPHGKAGFITGKDGKNYYFSLRDVTSGRNAAAPGIRVTFITVLSYDPVKQKPSVKAINIQAII